MDILENEIDFIGIVEKFDISLLLMKQLMSLDKFDIRYSRKNTATTIDLKKEDISESIIDKDQK